MDTNFCQPILVQHSYARYVVGITPEKRVTFMFPCFFASPIFRLSYSRYIFKFKHATCMCLHRSRVNTFCRSSSTDVADNLDGQHDAAQGFQQAQAANHAGFQAPLPGALTTGNGLVPHTCLLESAFWGTQCCFKHIQYRRFTLCSIAW